MAAAVRITEQTRVKLELLAKETGKPIPAVVEAAVETYRRQRLLEETNWGYGLLRSDPEAWQAELDERRTWEATLLDGLESDAFSERTDELLSELNDG